MKPAFIIALLVMASVSCSSSPPPKTEVTIIDYRNTDGAYVLAYSADDEFRVSLEDQLVVDLVERELNAFPSHPDIPDITASSREEVLTFAKQKKAMFVLVVEEVGQGETGVVQEQDRITQAHPSLQDFYDNSTAQDHDHAGGQKFVEVSAFLIQGESAKLVWSGTTWSVEGDGEGDRVADISATIADAIKQARQRRRLGFD